MKIQTMKALDYYPSLPNLSHKSAKTSSGEATVCQVMCPVGLVLV